MPARNTIKGNVRRAQLITTYGVGSVIPIQDESFMVAGTEHWSTSTPDLHEPRLERELRVHGFVRPPASENGGDVPIVRFPEYYSCPSCKRVNHHRWFAPDPSSNTCNACGPSAALVPSRFVVVCERGHIDDFPYFEWVHAGTERTQVSGRHELSISATGVSASLRDIVISCSCGKSVTMAGSFGAKAMIGVKKCTGRRPWLGDNEPCDLYPRTLQRGASNVYFGVLRSALSIPPWSEGAYKVINSNWHILQHIPEDALLGTIVGMRLAENSSFSAQDLVTAVKQRKRRESGEPEGEENTSLRREEYEALMRGRTEVSRDQDFVCERLPEDERLSPWFDTIMQVKRLREVRALEGFTRLLPLGPGENKDKMSPLSATPMEWLPAIEVIGEGVFLNLVGRQLIEWENRPSVRTRVEKLRRRYADKFLAFKAAPPREITPRLVLIHTLAHALINQWSLEAGYPAASLRERLFTEGDMAGLLIYTASSDSAGSLGGLIAQASPERLASSLTEAIHSSSWCSSDPLCIESEASGADA